MNRIMLVVVMIVLLACACAGVAQADGEAEVGDTSIGILYSTQVGFIPCLQGSLMVYANDALDFELYTDTYVAVDLRTWGAGISIRPPDNTPFLGAALNFLNADRIGPALNYDFNDEVWVGSVVFIKTF